MRETYHIELEDGHMILACAGRIMLVDTGSQVSLTDCDSFAFAGKLHKKRSGFKDKAIQMVRELLGFHIDVLLGMDVLADYALTIDYKRQTLEVSDEPMNFGGAPTIQFMTVFSKVPFVRANVGDKQYYMALDTGAKISYVRKEATDGVEPVDFSSDFHPVYGRFETEIFELDVTVGDHSFMCEFGVLPPSFPVDLSKMMLGGVLGYDFFKKFRVRLDFRRSLMALDRQ